MSHWIRRYMPTRGITTLEESLFIGYFLEGFFYGIYSGIFIIYLQHQASEKYKGTTILFYPFCALYVLSLALITVDITRIITEEFVPDFSLMAPLAVISPIIGDICNFIAQSTLIYRCWIVWNRNIWVVIMPSILAFACLGTWTAKIVETHYLDLLGQAEHGHWGVIVTSRSLPMIVNAVVTGLIVFRILTIYYRRVKPVLHDQASGATGWNKLRPVIFILIESGIALFSIQLATLMTGSVVQTTSATLVYRPLDGMQQMLMGMTPTIIQVRVLMGSSFHDTESMVEVTSSLHFTSDHCSESQVSETGSIIRIAQQESRNSDDCAGDEPSNNIDIVKSTV